MTARHTGRPRLYLLFNHHLTPGQEKEARDQLGIGELVWPPPSLRRLWAAIPPEAESLGPVLEPLFSWLGAVPRAGDHILVQGDFGACYLVVRRAMDLGLVPVYSTTRREASEQANPDGSVDLRHRVRHVRFRCYGS